MASAESGTLEKEATAGEKGYEFSICTAHPVLPEHFLSNPVFEVHHVWAHAYWYNDPKVYRWHLSQFHRYN